MKATSGPLNPEVTKVDFNRAVENVEAESEEPSEEVSEANEVAGDDVQPPGDRGGSDDLGPTLLDVEDFSGLGTSLRSYLDYLEGLGLNIDPVENAWKIMVDGEWVEIKTFSQWLDEEPMEARRGKKNRKQGPVNQNQSWEGAD